MNITEVNLFILFCIIVIPIKGQNDLKYATYRFHHEREEKLQFHDYTNDGLPDIILESGRNLHFYTYRTKNRFSDTPDLILYLPFPYSYYDFRKRGEKEELALLYPGGIDLIRFMEDGFTTPPQSLQAQSIEIYPEISKVHYSEFFQDIDGDGHDDLLIPEPDFFCIYFADNFTSPVLKIPMNENFSFFRYDLSFDISSPFQNRFGLWRYKGIYYFTIEEPGKPGSTQLKTQTQTYILSPEKTFITKKNPESDIDSEDDDFQNEEAAFTLNHFDFNGDDKRDRAEIITKEGGFAPKTSVKIYLRGEDGRLPPKADHTITAGAIMPNWNKPPFEDVDGDGDVDLILLDLDFHGSSLESNLKVFLKKGLSGELDFYLWDRNSGYPKYPSFSFPIQIKWEFFNYLTPTEDYYYIGQDFTGDGKPDLLVKTGAKEFSLHPFINEKEGFDRKDIYRFQLPGACRNFDLLDLNHDKIPDLHFICRDDSDKNISLDILFISDIK